MLISFILLPTLAGHRIQELKSPFLSRQPPEGAPEPRNRPGEVRMAPGRGRMRRAANLSQDLCTKRFFFQKGWRASPAGEPSLQPGTRSLLYPPCPSAKTPMWPGHDTVLCKPEATLPAPGAVLARERPQQQPKARDCHGNTCAIISLLTDGIHFQQHNFKTALQCSGQAPPTAPLENANALFLDAALKFLRIFEDTPHLLLQEMTVQ